MSNKFDQRPDGKKLPDAWPPGWVFLKYALADFGSAYQREKGGWPFNVPDLYFTPLASTRADALAYAHKVAPQVMDAFSDLLRRGELDSGYTLLGGGAVEPIPAGWWFTTAPRLRYRTWSINPADPFSEDADLPCWIWVNADQLSAILDKMGRDFNGWGPVPTYEDWLAQQPLPKRETAAGRPDKTVHILKLFRLRVEADTVLERAAWEAKAIWQADATNPERATPKTIEDRIRPYFNAVERSASGIVTNKDAVLREIDLAINGF